MIVKFIVYTCIAVIILAVGFASFSTNAFAYYLSSLPQKIKSIFIGLHVFVSFITAAILPNNYLNQIAFINELYNESGLWVAFSFIVLLVLAIVIYGYILTWVLRKVRII